MDKSGFSGSADRHGTGGTPEALVDAEVPVQVCPLGGLLSAPRAAWRKRSR